MAQKTVTRVVDMRGFRPHNGEGRPDLMFQDPVNREWIGGQVAACRMAMRYRHTVYPWARRQGKTTSRQITLQAEATITTGPFYQGICYPDHTTAYKIMQSFIESWGDMVKDAKNNDKDQDRWVELHPFVPPPGDPPDWFTEPMKERWARCQAGDGNTRVRLYAWSTTYPFFRKIQGFPHHFNRVDWDECQEIHPAAYGIVRPMCDDIGAPECFSGTPWKDGIGNWQFEKWWKLAIDPNEPEWFGMRIPHGTNPHVTKSSTKGMTESEIAQVRYARFLTDEGALFSNLNNVFILQPMDPKDSRLDWVRALRTRFRTVSIKWWVYRNKPLNGHTHAASIDWARSPKGDYSVLTVFDLTTNEQVALFRWRGEDFTAQMEVVLAVCQHYGCSELHADNNGMGLSMVDFMRRRHSMGWVGHKFGTDKRDYVRRCQILFIDSDLALINCPEQYNEFKSFQAHESVGIGSEKRITYAAPSGEHDDFVAAVLHLAPTITLCGRREVRRPPPEAKPLFDEKGRTTLEAMYGEDHLPFEDAPTDEISWNDVVIPGL